MFPIGMFPWIMLACATLLLAPDWPRAWLGAPATRSCARQPRALWIAVGIHCLVQLLVPLHHHLLVRDSAWTNQGFDFAWKVMLAEKTGRVRLTARDRANGRTWTITPATYLTPLQEHALGKDPQLIIAFARHVHSDLRERSGIDAAIFSDAFASLNGRPAQRLVAADIDLTRNPLPPNLILPLRQLPDTASSNVSPEPRRNERVGAFRNCPGWRL
jgi:hypothetical protein